MLQSDYTPAEGGKTISTKKIAAGLAAAAAVGALAYAGATHPALPGAAVLEQLVSSHKPKNKDRTVLDGRWGGWKGWHRKGDSGWVACGMKVRLEPSISGDDTALNGLQLRFCHKDDWWRQTTEEIYPGLWGSWARDFTMCPYKAFITSVQARNEGPQSSGDDTALNGLKFRCRYKNWVRAGEWTASEGMWGGWGGWSSTMNYGNYYVTGAEMRFEDPDGDDTAANGLHIETTRMFLDQNVLTPGWRMAKSGYDVSYEVEEKVESS